MTDKIPDTLFLSPEDAAAFGRKYGHHKIGFGPCVGDPCVQYTRAETLRAPWAKGYLDLLNAPLINRVTPTCCWRWPMPDPRHIPMADIDWRTLMADMGRSVRPLWRLSEKLPDQPARDYCRGGWDGLTLGQVADKGEREIRRHNGVGPTTIARLREIIDMARAGTLPLKGGPASDTLWPADREGNGRFSGDFADNPPAQFLDWFCRNYPADTIIGKPEWHAPKVWRAAMYAAQGMEDDG